jgi:predicted nucleic acid-binding protein
MILADTSIWIDHLRSGNPTLAGLLENTAIVAHPWVTGGLAPGNLHRRQEVLALLRALPQVRVADDDEVLTLIDRAQLSGLGIGHVDAQLLAATKLTVECSLWTRDKRLATVAARLRTDFDPAPQRRSER